MKQVFILILILINVNFVFATEQKKDSLMCDTIYSKLDTLVIQPEYKGGIIWFLKFCEQESKPPSIIPGLIPAKARVIIEFSVDNQGKVFAPSILRIARIYYNMEIDEIYENYDKHWSENIDFDYCQKEAIRILNLVEFIPAKKINMNVCFEKMITIINVYYAAGGYD